MPGRTAHLIATALAVVALAIAGCVDDDDESSNGGEDTGAAGGGGYGSRDTTAGMEGTLTVN